MTVKSGKHTISKFYVQPLLPDNTEPLDANNRQIILELLTNPNLKSKQLAAKLRMPLSTIQRRRTKLEETILKKTYTIDLRLLGWRLADLFIEVGEGKSMQIAKALLSNPNVLAVSTRIGDPNVNVLAEVFYKSTEELYGLVETVKAMSYVKDVEWSEVVNIVSNGGPRTVKFLGETIGAL